MLGVDHEGGPHPHPHPHRVRSPQTNGVLERFFGTLKYERLYWPPIDDGDALATEAHRYRHIYNTGRHQALGDRVPL